MRGYICAPSSGAYTFWISSDDKSELWLSTDDKPANKRKIAGVTGNSTYQQWTKYPSQQSSPVSLVAGVRYYIEALHKEGSGVDHLSVGWQLPSGQYERPIPVNRLSPFENSASASATLQTEIYNVEGVESGGGGISLFPNPLAGRNFNIRFLNDQVIAGGNLHVQVVSSDGREILNGYYFYDVNTRLLTIEFPEDVIEGLYLVSIIAHGKRFQGRLVAR